MAWQIGLMIAGMTAAFFLIRRAWKKIVNDEVFRVESGIQSQAVKMQTEKNQVLKNKIQEIQRTAQMKEKRKKLLSDLNMDEIRKGGM